MAFRTWGRLLLTALGVSVLAGAGQLGIAYGFGVVRLDGAFVDGSVNRWPAQLAWVGWFAAVATVAGAVLTERLARRDTSPAGTTELLSIAGVSALGAIVVAPLCMQPARAAELGGTVDPVWAVGICAILGAVVGAGAAIAVLLKPPFGWSIALTAAAVWLLALVSAAPSVASTGTLTTVRLGVLEPSWLDPAAAERLAMLLLPTLALLVGAAVGALARRAGHLPLVGGAAGAAGPVLLAFAYLTAGPGTAADRYQLAPYYGALIAVAAGALGSTATTVLPRPVSTADGPDAIEPTDILQALPASPATPGPADPAPAAPLTVRPAGAPRPAHWDWPEAGGLTPVPAGLTRQPLGRPAVEPPADRDEPTPGHGSGPAGEPAATGPGSTRHRLDAPQPVAGGSSPIATDRARAAEETDRREPDTESAWAFGDPVPDEPATGRNDEEPTRNLPMPGSLPPGRRTSAIDVLAAGRPTPPAEPDPVPRPATTTEPAHPAASHAESTPTTDRSEAPSVAPAPTRDRTAGSEPARDRTAGSEPARDRTAAAEREVSETTPAGPATEAAPTRTTRSRRSRTTAPAAQPADAASPTTRSADGVPAKAEALDGALRTTSSADDAPSKARPRTGALPNARAVDDTPSTAQPADSTPPASAAEAAAVESAPAPAGRAKRARKPRTTRTATDRAAAEPTTTTSDDAEAAATTPDHTAEPAGQTPDHTVERTGSKPDRTVERAGSKPEHTVEAAGSKPERTVEPTGSKPDRTVEPSGSKPPAGQVTAAAAAAATEHTPGDAPAAAVSEASVPAAPAPVADPAGDPSGGSTPAAGERRNFFFAPEPAPADLPEPPASPRPRIPIFEDVTPGNVRPAWPIAPAPNWPVTPRGGTEPAEPGGPTAGPDGDRAGTRTPEATRPEPAPRPRHRALPDLGRSTGWDALANARPAGPTAPPPAGRAPETTGPAPEATGLTGRAVEATGSAGQAPEATGPAGQAPETTGPVLPAWDGPAPEKALGGRHADVSEADEAQEAAGGKGKARRGLFRRNRGKGGEPGEADRESEPLAAQDEEFVDWVAGLASDDNADDARSLRTGRHHRD
ncbi:hypothetical protein AB0F68_17195 [Micromonospora sp. NPDC023966]|uniref:hypothetical protein n=1 Tax=Micromonospora sp. NPDC023966 TaxID=3154699 RepID=UPI0033C8B9C7